MAKKNSLLHELLQERELDLILAHLKKENKDDKKKDDDKKSKPIPPAQIALLSILVWPILGPVIFATWKLSGKLIYMIATW